ncbi:MAG: hypothetical protein M1818_007558 [Claussenomyces sp. TS43310]|nr:MAG: hypothetical protein M1818_007558 [Claussenomyces sp. TS43310]
MPAMYTCTSCTRRIFKDFIAGSLLFQSRQSSEPITRCTLRNNRDYSTAAATAIRRDEDYQVSESSSSLPQQRSHQGHNHRPGRGRDVKKSSTAFGPGKQVTRRPGSFAPLYQNQAASLKDPLKLAEAVREYLRGDNYDEARTLVEFASKTTACIVSWNHLIDWQLSKGKVNAAIKTYNQMKKRGQIPDAHTYTILFRGMANHSDEAKNPTVLAKALSIYHSMAADNAPLKANIIHTNAVLKVCARAQDMDALFGVAAKLPAKGFRAANNLTFTTILNAVRQHALRGQISPETASRNRAKAIHDSRRMWDDIVTQWRSGDIWIDEELVCSMGRVLLLGERRDVDDVFSLLEQAMGIPRPFPRLGTEARDKIEPSRQTPHSAMLKEPETVDSDKVIVSRDANGGNSLAITSQDEFKTVKPPSSKGQSAYAKVGRNALSLICEALLSLRMKAPMTAYWKLLTTTYGVKPDGQNYNGYLRILRVARASAETVAVLHSMPRSMLERKTFRIAMAACERDKNNPSAFANGNKVLELMQSTLADPDLIVLHSFLDLACSAPVHSPVTPLRAQHEDPRFASGQQIKHALDRLGPSIIHIKAALAYGDPSSFAGEKMTAASYRQSVILLLRKMISAYDKLLGQNMHQSKVSPSEYTELTNRRSQFAAYVTRLREKELAVQGGGKTRASST